MLALPAQSHPKGQSHPEQLNNQPHDPYIIIGPSSTQIDMLWTSSMADQGPPVYNVLRFKNVKQPKPKVYPHINISYAKSCTIILFIFPMLPELCTHLRL